MARVPDELFRFSLKDLAQICQVTERTARRWREGQTVTPGAVIILLRALISRDLGFLHPAWTGWVISQRGELCSPENWICTPGQVRALQLKEAQVAALQHQVLELKMELEDLTCAGMEEQPLPEQWEFKVG